MGSIVLCSTMDNEIQSSIISSFLEITTEKSVETAKHFLAETSWKLDEAVNLFFLKKADDDKVSSSGSSSSSSSSSSSPVIPPLMKNPNHGFCKDEDQVTDSLSPSEDDEIWKESACLSSLMFHGSFEKAKQVASKKSKWLLLNLQSRKKSNSDRLSKDSRRLNRETWSNVVVAEIIKRNFIFLQVYDDTIEGMRISTSYQLIGSITPMVILVDPITERSMWTWNGMIEGELLMQELFPYIDVGVEGIHSSLETSDVSEVEDKEEELDEEIVLALEASMKDHKEELNEEMVLALEASMKGLMYDDDDASISTDIDEEPPLMYEESSSDEEDNYLIEKKKKITYPALPEEPEEPQTADENLVSKVGFRFPQDGASSSAKFTSFRLTVPQGIIGAVSFEESIKKIHLD